MSDVSVINEDAVRAYAGKMPIDVVGECIDAGKPFTDVERAYCSQYFTEQFALLDADEEFIKSYDSDPVFYGLDVRRMLENGEPLPAYAQERQDMYDKIDSDFAGRAESLIGDFMEAYDLMKNAEQVTGRFSGDGRTVPTCRRSLRWLRSKVAHTGCSGQTPTCATSTCTIP